MGVASNLFYSTDTVKQTLHRRIVPTEEQQALQQERWVDLMEYLSGDLGETTGYPISSWLQGSYKFKTQIRPSKKGQEFDIDLGIYFEWSGNPEDGNYGPLELKSLVQESLEKYKGETGEEVIDVVSPPKTRCSRICFTQDFHIDVPSYHIDSDRDARTLATEEDVWEKSDPKALYEWFNNQYSDVVESSQLRRLVRYFKMWVALHFEAEHRPTSILLTILVVEALNSVNLAEVDGDDVAFGLCIEGIIERLSNDQSVLNPVDSSEEINRLDDAEFKDFQNGLNNLASIAERALKADTEFESATIWQEAFYQFFPFPIPEESIQKTLSLVPVQFDPQVTVTVVSRDNHNYTRTENNKIGPIPKNCTLTFNINNVAQLPAGAKVQWIARNEGEEAEYENDLGHLVADESTKITDSTAYKGTHFMDVVIKSAYGEILGFRRIPVEVTGVAMPPRNPKKKPGWIRFRNKRK